MRSIPPYWKPEYEAFKRRIGADPDTPEGARFLAKISPLRLAHKIKKPILIAQGANDPRVRLRESQQIVDALRKNGIPFTYMVFPNEGHSFLRPENSMAFHAETEQFLARCLGGRAEPIHDELEKSTVRVEHYNGVR